MAVVAEVRLLILRRAVGPSIGPTDSSGQVSLPNYEYGIRRI